MKKIYYSFLRALIYAFSLLPFRITYAVSDLLYLVVYHCVRYRRDVVRRNIVNSFPEKTADECLSIEREFYHAFIDHVLEMFKLLSMSPSKMRRHMTFSGYEDIEKSLESHEFCFVYLGHSFNWEWISTLPMWFSVSGVKFGQLYHPVHGKFLNWLLLGMRSRFGAENIPKNDALRHILTLRNEGKKEVIGFIADQGPRWVNIHEWVNFLSQDTPVYTGTERIAKKVNASIYFANVVRVKRGFYHCKLERITEDVKSWPNYTLTDEYMHRLESMIRRNPSNWLWTHNRWKRRRDNEPEHMGKHATQGSPLAHSAAQPKA